MKVQGWVSLAEEDAHTCKMSGIPMAGMLSLGGQDGGFENNKAI